MNRLHEMTKPIFWEKNKRNIFKLLSAEFVHGVVMVNIDYRSRMIVHAMKRHIFRVSSFEMFCIHKHSVKTYWDM